MESFDISAPSDWKFMEMLRSSPPPLAFTKEEKSPLPPAGIEKTEAPKVIVSPKPISDLMDVKVGLPKLLELNFTDKSVEKEMIRIRDALTINEFEGTPRLKLPAPKGPLVTLRAKYYVPVNQYPGYNFAGRILGPRGMTARQFEQKTGCNISLRGKGRDNRKAIANYGPQDCFNDELHVVVWCEDTFNRCQMKMDNAVEHVMRLITPEPEEVKQKQLMKLALFNNTYNPYYC